MVTALARIFGLENIALAEDVTQDVFCRALEVWKLRGVPENPSAWLMKAAKNRAIDLLRRERVARRLEPALGQLLESEWTLVPTVNEFFSAESIRDDELRMIFSCCDPQLSETTQVVVDATSRVRFYDGRNSERLSAQAFGDGKTDRTRQKSAGRLQASF